VQAARLLLGPRAGEPPAPRPESTLAPPRPPGAPLPLRLLALRLGGGARRRPVVRAAAEPDPPLPRLVAHVGAVIGQERDQFVAEAGVFGGEHADGGPAHLDDARLELRLDDGAALAAEVLVEQFAPELLRVAVVAGRGDAQAVED